MLLAFLAPLTDFLSLPGEELEGSQPFWLSGPPFPPTGVLLGSLCLVHLLRASEAATSLGLR